jgi:hypothetical protein
MTFGRAFHRQRKDEDVERHQLVTDILGRHADVAVGIEVGAGSRQILCVAGKRHGNFAGCRTHRGLVSRDRGHLS